MKQRRRAIAGMSAVTTSFVGWIATGCLDVDPIIDEPNARPFGDAGGFANGNKRIPEQQFDPQEPRCKDTTASFRPKSIPAAYPARRACTLAQIQALGGACNFDATGDPNTDSACLTARADNAACAQCIFGTKDDPEEKIVTLFPGERPNAKINTSACIDHSTGVAGCGGQFVNIKTCFDTFCELKDKGGACLSDSQVSDCVKLVRDADCKEFLISDPTCGEGIQNAKECFPAAATAVAMRAFFERAANIACGEKAVVTPLKDGGS